MVLWRSMSPQTFAAVLAYLFRSKSQEAPPPRPRQLRKL